MILPSDHRTLLETLLLCRFPLTSPGGTVSGINNFFDIGSRVLVRRPNSLCAGDECIFLVGVFQKSSRAR